MDRRGIFTQNKNQGSKLNVVSLMFPRIMKNVP